MKEEIDESVEEVEIEEQKHDKMDEELVKEEYAEDIKMEEDSSQRQSSVVVTLTNIQHMKILLHGTLCLCDFNQHKFL